MKKDTWKMVIQIAISILTAIATTIFKHPTSYYFKKMLYLCQRNKKIKVLWTSTKLLK